ncbi:MAG: recombination protein NinB [Gallionellaceae bacterium]
MNKRIILRTPQIIAHAVETLQAIEPDNDAPMEMIIRPWKSKRSGQQNRRLHKIIGECAKESGYTIEEMKMVFKTEILEPVSWFDYKGHKCPQYESTAQMNVTELNAMMEGVENLAALWYSVVLPYDGMEER